MTQPVDTPLEGEIVEEIRTIALNATISVRVKNATEEQLTVLTKASAAARRNQAAIIPALDIAFRVIQKLLVDEADVDRIDDALIEGTLKVSELATIFSQEQTSAAKPRAVRTRRGR